MSISATTVEVIKSDEDLILFQEYFAREFGHNIGDLNFMRGCTVFLFRDQMGDPVGGYCINTDQSFRVLSGLPIEIADDFRRKAVDLDPYEINMLWVDKEHRLGRIRNEIWLHTFETMLERKNQVLLIATTSDILHEMYVQAGMQTIFDGTIIHKNETLRKRVMYSANIMSTQVPALREMLRKRLGLG